MFFLHRIWNWCSRFRHRCGYGVHSPSDFFLITSVVYEKYHYYAYRVLKERGFPAYLPHYRRKVNRLLFFLSGTIIIKYGGRHNTCTDTNSRHITIL